MSLTTTLFPLLSLLAVAPPAAPVEPLALEQVASTSESAGAWIFHGGTALFAISYGLTVGVSLMADRHCEGSVCNERYLSLLPVVGPLLQVAVAGEQFHDDHHTEACVPRIFAAVGGQAVGVAAMVLGAYLHGRSDPDEPEQAAWSVLPETYGGDGFGLRLGYSGW